MEPLVFSIKRHGTKLPAYKRTRDAGLDLRAGKHFFCKPGRNKVPCGIRFKLPSDTEGSIRPRSGNNNEGIPGVTLEDFYKKCGEDLTTWAANAASHFDDTELTFYDMLEMFVDAHEHITFSEKELKRFNCDVLIGTVEDDYRGEVSTSLYSKESQVFIIPRNARISQMVITPVIHARVVEGEFDEDTERGSDGWGSSGIM